MRSNDGKDTQAGLAATSNLTYSPIVPYFTENNTLYSHYSVIIGTLRHGDYPNHESLYVLT